MHDFQPILVTRKNIINFCQPFIEGDKRLLIFRAGAGYGKSVAALQVADFAKLPVVKIMCTPVDRNPTQLAYKLLRALQPLQANLNVAKALKPLQKSGTPEEALLAARDSFKAAFSDFDSKAATIFLDDAHLLNKSSAIHLLRLSYDLMPRDYKFIITSRQTLAENGKPIFTLLESLLVNRTQLEFDRLEIAELYQNRFAIALTFTQTDLLLEATDGGWPVGVVLLKDNVAKLEKGWQLIGSNETSQYFIQECLKDLPIPIVEQLSLLAQLDEIPSNMLIDLGLSQAYETLDNLCELGLFTAGYHSVDGQYCYKFHHLFSEALRHLINDYVSVEHLQQFNNMVCQWLEINEKTEDALLLLVRSRNWEEVSQFMRRNGTKLLASHKLDIVKDSLSDCPSEVILNDEWLSAIYGTSILFISPSEAVKLLEHAYEVANENDEDIAQLIAGIGLLNYLLLLGSNLWKMRSISRNVAKLVEKILKIKGNKFSLAPLCAYLLPPTIAYSSSDYDFSMRFTDMLKEYYQRKISKDTPEEFFFADLYAYKFMGNTRRVIDLMQSKIFSVNDISENPGLRFFIIGFFANLYAMLAIKDYYYDLFEETTKRFPEISGGSALACFFRVFDMDLLLADGKYERVIQIANDSMLMDIIAKNPHVSSACLLYGAMAKALLGHHEEALVNIKRALLLRAKSGGPIFILMVHNVYAAILSLSGEEKKALRVFNSTLKRSISLRDGYQRPMIYAYRANLNLNIGNEKEALVDIHSMLECMEHYSNTHFYFWDSKIMLRLFKFYLSHNHPTPFIVKLIKDRFKCDVMPDGILIPRLHISLAEQKIGSQVSNDVFLLLNELPGVEAKLMKLLIVRNGRQIAIQECIEYLWDDPDKMKDARNNFYVYLNKLRSRIASVVGKYNAKHYLINKAGFVALKHIDVDQYHCENQATKALRLLDKKQWWDAELRFRRVHRLLEKFPEDFAWSPKNKRLFTDAALAWSDLAQKCQDSNAVIKATEMGLRFDPAHDHLHKLRYRTYLQLDMLAKAENAKHEYAREISVDGRALHELGKSML